MASTTPHHQGRSDPKFERSEGTAEMTFAPKDLSITWGEDSRYWNVPKEEGSAAELYQVCWLEVTLRVDGTSPAKDYEVGFNISMTPDAFGWKGSPVYVMVKRGKNGTFRGSKFSLEKYGKDQVDIAVTLPKSVKTSDDLEIEKIHFGMYEVWRGKWKGGLKIHHAFVREKSP